MKTKRSRTATTNPFGKLDPLPIGGDVRRRLQSRPYFRTPPFFVKAKKETGVSGFCSFSSSSSTVSTAGFIVAMDVLRLGVCFSVPPSLLLREVSLNVLEHGGKEHDELLNFHNHHVLFLFYLTTVSLEQILCGEFIS